MAGPDPNDDTSADYEQFEIKLLAQDHDVAGVDTADIDDTMARSLVDDLVDADVVTPIPEDRVLVHEPSGTAFDSATQIAVYHRGWTAARDAIDSLLDQPIGGVRKLTVTPIYSSPTNRLARFRSTLAPHSKQPRHLSRDSSSDQYN